MNLIDKRISSPGSKQQCEERKGAEGEGEVNNIQSGLYLASGRRMRSRRKVSKAKSSDLRFQCVSAMSAGPEDS